MKIKTANKRNTGEGAVAQKEFRDNVAKVYGYKCAVTQTRVQIACQAAHVFECKNTDEDNFINAMDITNGILLRRDWHIGFDKQLWGIHPTTLTIVMGEKMKKISEYEAFNGKKIHLPKDVKNQPNSKALKARFAQFEEVEAKRSRGEEVKFEEKDEE
jgi:predicted restriction endonuclease